MNAVVCAGAVYNNYLYFSNAVFNALMRMNLESYEVEYICDFPEEGKGNRYIHKRCFVYMGETLVFTPQRGRTLHIYNVNNRVITTIFIGDSGEQIGDFCDAQMIGDCVYLIPDRIDQFVWSVDVKTFEVKKSICLNEERAKCLSIENGLFWKACVVNSKILIPVIWSNYLLIYDTKSDVREVVNTSITDLDSAYFVNGKVLLCTMDSKIYEWDSKTNTSRLLNYPEYVVDRGSSIVSESNSGDIYVIPNHGKNVLKIKSGFGGYDICNGSLDNPKSSKSPNYENYDNYNNKLVVFSRVNSVVELIGDDITEIHIILNEVEMEKCKDNMLEAMRMELKQGDCVKENECLNLNTYIGSLL